VQKNSLCIRLDTQITGACLIVSAERLVFEMYFRDTAATMAEMTAIETGEVLVDGSMQFYAAGNRFS
jgi:hypothetical protein